VAALSCRHISHHCRVDGDDGDTDVDLFGAKPFTVPIPQSPQAAVGPRAAGTGDVFGMPVFSPVSPTSAFDQEMIDMQVIDLVVWSCKAKQKRFRQRRRPKPLCPPNYIEHNL